VSAFIPEFGLALSGYTIPTPILDFGSPLLYLPFLASVFVEAERPKRFLWLLLLAPVAFWHLGETILALLIWRFGGGFAP